MSQLYYIIDSAERFLRRCAAYFRTRALCLVAFTVNFNTLWSYHSILIMKFNNETKIFSSLIKFLGLLVCTTDPSPTYSILLSIWINKNLSHKFPNFLWKVYVYFYLRNGRKWILLIDLRTYRVSSKSWVQSVLI